MSATMFTAYSLLLLLVSPYTCQEASYSILTTWDGGLVRHPPATLTLTATEDGDLSIHIEAR